MKNKMIKRAIMEGVNMNRNKQIKLGATLSYISIAINIIAGLLYTPWMIEQIGDGQYGLYTLANSIITLFLVDFGLSTATTKFVSKYRAEGNEEKANNFLGAIYKLYLLIDAIIFTILIVVFFLSDSIYANLTPTELQQFKVVYVISALFAVVNFPFVTLNGILTANEKFIPLKLADVIYRVLYVGMTVIALLLGYGLYALVTVHAIAGLLIIVYKLIVIKKTTGTKPNFKYQDKSIYKDIFSLSIWMTIATLAQRLIFNITPTILGITIKENTSETIAIFGVITTIEAYIYTFTTAINGMFMPKISRIYANKNSEEAIMPLMIKVGRFQYVLNGLMIVGFFTVGQLFVGLWMGDAYSLSYFGVLLVIIPGLFYNSMQIANTTLIVRDKAYVSAIVNTVIGVINIVLSFILSIKFGVIGACVSIFVAYTVRFVLYLILFKTTLKLNMALFVKECYIKMGIPLVISASVGYFIKSYLTANSWWSLLICGALISITYAVLVGLMGTSKAEKKMLIVRIKKMLKK